MNDIDKYSDLLLQYLGNEYKETGQASSHDGDKLLQALEISTDNLNDAVEILDTNGFIKRIDYKAAPFDFGQISLSTSGKKTYLDMDKKIGQELKVFISHSSADSEVVKLIIKLLRSSLNLKPKEILCTSVEGQKLSPGVNTDEILKKEVHEAQSFIGVITENSIKSSYVLFEIGARWGANLSMIPIICDQKGTSILSGPLKNINCLNHKTRGDIYSMVDSISEALKIDKLPTNSFLDEVEAKLNFDANQIIESNRVKPENAILSLDVKQGKSEILSEAEIPEDIKEAIKTNAKIKWEDDFEMVVHTIKDQ